MILWRREIGGRVFCAPKNIDILWGYNYRVMKINYDPVKREVTLAERGLDFEDAVAVFEGLVLTVEDARRDYGERRFQSVGFLDDIMVMLVWTPRATDTRHIISMRRCNDRERSRYQKFFDES
jgi:uncharacterized protein